MLTFLPTEKMKGLVVKVCVCVCHGIIWHNAKNPEHSVKDCNLVYVAIKLCEL